MATKNKPGEFDCYAAAEPDEPMFILLARDPSAPFLVSIWGYLRAGDVQGAFRCFQTMRNQLGVYYEDHPEVTEKTAEALSCAAEMRNWREVNRKPLGI